MHQCQLRHSCGESRQLVTGQSSRFVPLLSPRVFHTGTCTHLAQPSSTLPGEAWSLINMICRVRVLDIRFLPTLLLCRCREERSCALLSTSRVLVPQTTLAMTRRRMQCRPKRKSTHYTQQFTQPNSAAPVITKQTESRFPSTFTVSAGDTPCSSRRGLGGQAQRSAGCDPKPAVPWP